MGCSLWLLVVFACGLFCMMQCGGKRILVKRLFLRITVSTRNFGQESRIVEESAQDLRGSRRKKSDNFLKLPLEITDPLTTQRTIEIGRAGAFSVFNG